MWTEPAISAEASSVRRWGRRVLPSRVGRALLMLFGIVVIVVGYGRLYWAVNEMNLFCVPGWGSDCGEYLEDRHLDIWDAIF